MSRIDSAIALTVAIILSASCSKVDNHQAEQPASGPFEVTITGEMGGFDVSTKSDIESVIRMKWNTTDVDDEKDVVWVYGQNSGGTEFKCLSSTGLKATSSEDNPYTATLSGTIDEMPSDGYLYLIHCPSGTYSQPTVTAEGAITVDMSAVEQSSSVTPFIIYSSVQVSATSLNGLFAKFSFATSVMKVNVTGLTAGAILTKATVTRIDKNCSLSFNGGSVSVTAAKTNVFTMTGLGTFTKNLSVLASESGKASFMLAVPAMSSLLINLRLLTVYAGGVYVTRYVFPNCHQANSYVNTVYSAEKIILPGKFSVSATKQVQFTRGNLYYYGSYFSLESGQTVYPVQWNSSHVGHFYWAVDKSYSYAYSYGYEGATSSDDVPFFAESGGGISINSVEGLFALTKDEWTYLISGRTVNGGTGIGYSYRIATINSDETVNTDLKSYGMIIYPDDYVSQTTSTTYTSAEWAEMESSGCVFLPAAGCRSSNEFSHGGAVGLYWSSTPSTNMYGQTCYYMHFGDGVSQYGAVAAVDGQARNVGSSIRLVSVAQ